MLDARLDATEPHAGDEVASVDALEARERLLSNERLSEPARGLNDVGGLLREVGSLLIGSELLRWPGLVPKAAMPGAVTSKEVIYYALRKRAGWAEVSKAERRCE